MNERNVIALVAVGGFVGAATRYAVSFVLPPFVSSVAPSVAVPSLVSTFAVNAVGCFALGYLLYAYRFGVVSERVRLLTATGFLSSFTTYSTFAYDVFEASPAVAVVYIVASYGVGFSAVYAGTRTALRGEA
ncbi:MAG: CrcB family protein [Halobacteriales archaeon]|nr:CrcB family protein [Halobacteriales archaeon]